MRNRFFGIILAVLFVVSLGAVTMHSLLLEQARFDLIDQQVRETASALVDSELNDLRKIDFERANQIISEELGENRIGKFFIIRTKSGETIFETTGANLLKIDDIPQEPRWLTFRGSGEYIRVLNLQLPGVPDRTLQVGLVVDENLVNPNYFSITTLYFIATLLALGAGVAWGLSFSLLAPIRRLGRFVNLVSQRLSSATELPTMPAELRFADGSNRQDEFHRLTAGFDAMIEKLNRNHKVSRLWAYQMAHELKTPLAHIEVEIERGLLKKELSPAVAEAVSREVMAVSDTVSSFLSWAELENSSGQKRLFATRISKVVDEIAGRLGKLSGNQLKIDVREDFLVLAASNHLEQLVQNLISNALKYSPVGRAVEIRIESPRLVIRDQGPGIPDSVLACLGEPFNRGVNSVATVKGHGLGLAWIISLCRLYGWKTDFGRDAEGTKVSVFFPTEVAMDEALPAASPPNVREDMASLSH